MTDQYRRCVGMMILNNENKILVGKRLDHPSGHWQMPQGGIDDNENPNEAVWREMQEEIGTNNATIIQESTQWINYKIPLETLKTLPWGHKYVGQTQKWFLFRFNGADNEINVVTENPEFSEWRWSNHNLLVENIVPFKRNTYKKILEECFYYSQQLTEAKNQKKKEVERPPPVQQVYSSGTTELKTLDSKDLRIQKDGDFSLKLKSREEAFNSLINKPKPNQVTFEEKEQDVPSQNLDVLMKQSLADREKELQLILNNKGDKKAEEWLKPIETSDKPKESKKVSFNLEAPKDERQEVVNLLSKLKPKQVQSSTLNNEIINLLKKVLENQEKILSKLNNEDPEITAILED